MVGGWKGYELFFVWYFIIFIYICLEFLVYLSEGVEGIVEGCVLEEYRDVWGLRVGGKGKKKEVDGVEIGLFGKEKKKKGVGGVLVVF